MIASGDFIAWTLLWQGTAEEAGPLFGCLGVWVFGCRKVRAKGLSICWKECSLLLKDSPFAQRRVDHQRWRLQSQLYGHSGQLVWCSIGPA